MAVFTVEFDAAIQSLDALKAAVYRMIGTASCQIESRDGRWLCRLETTPDQRKQNAPSLDEIRMRFLDLVADENLRERITAKTEIHRNLILALAFGSLANESAKTNS